MKKAMIWKLLERFGVQGTNFILQIILARLLAPDYYGILSLLLIFISLSNVFVQQGFSTSLIQNKEVKHEDYSTVFWISESVALGLFLVLFICAPMIASFFGMEDIIWPFRVLSIMLFPGALQSVQLAKVSREMDFQKIFLSSIIAVVLSGVAGIILAYRGYGIWALVVQTLLNVLISSVVLWFSVSWHPGFVCNMQRAKALFSYGWKLLVSALVDTLYQDIRSLVIGKKYDSAILGYDTRGKQFPQFIINAINGTVQSVMLPAMSAKQEDKAAVKEVMRKSVTLSAYIIFPMMAGLAAVAEPLVELLLTEKWLLCVPYMQVYCFTLAFYPVHSCNLQTINAMGRSDLFLKLEIIKKTYGIAILAIAVFCFDSPLAIAMTGLVTTWVGWFVNSYPNKKLVSYSYLEQMVDIFPNLGMALIMCGCVWGIGRIDLTPFLLLVVQIIAGIIIYLLLSVILKPRAYILLMTKVKGLVRK